MRLLDTTTTVCKTRHMQNHTVPWWERADRLGVKSPLLAKATGANVFTVRAYRQGRFRPSTEWLEKVDRFLRSIEEGAA